MRPKVHVRVALGILFGIAHSHSRIKSPCTVPGKPVACLPKVSRCTLVTRSLGPSFRSHWWTSKSWAGAISCSVLPVSFPKLVVRPSDSVNRLRLQYYGKGSGNCYGLDRMGELTIIHNLRIQ